MTTYSFDWVDAFTSTAFGGNPCVVVHDAEGISLEDRMRLVRETRLSECAYIVPSEKADFGARYYLTHAEIPLAGHPTVATVASLISRGLVGPGEFTLEVGAGVLPIHVSDDLTVTMTQRAPEFGEIFEPELIAKMYGLAADDILGRPQIVSTGTAFCVTLLQDKDALRRAVLDPGLVAVFRDGVDHENAGILEPFLVTLGGATEHGDTFSRLLLAPPMPPEDSFTGSATGCMAAYLWHHGYLKRPSFVAEQGHWMDRPGAASVQVLGPREAITGVEVGGKGVVLMTGELAI
ncbi:MAG: PhzF family phenazine biosynthesis protein [Pseudomonadota bacterium]